MPRAKKDKSGLTCQLPKKTAETFAEQFEKAARFWDPNQAGQPYDDPDIEEEMKKFEQGFSYKPPEYKYNLFRQMLKERPRGKVKIIANDPEEQHLADQLTLLVNALREREDG